jgi:hypothetical protein
MVWQAAILHVVIHFLREIQISKFAEDFDGLSVISKSRRMLHYLFYVAL